MEEGGSWRRHEGIEWCSSSRALAGLGRDRTLGCMSAGMEILGWKEWRKVSTSRGGALRVDGTRPEFSR